MKASFLWLASIFIMVANSQAQDKQYVSGTVYTLQGDTLISMVGANIFWSGTAVGTTTDRDGEFQISMTEHSTELIISFVGFVSDTLQITKPQSGIDITLGSSVDLTTVNITYRARSTDISYMDPMQVQNISHKELQKAACCNLSESFETSPSVDVSFSDAVTGTRQIQMLGLAGPYTQIMRENFSDVRGLSSLYGMTYTPGHWVESIQLNKGTGSVVNGFESIAGQINVELWKPESADKFSYNLYANEMGRIEMNALFNKKISEKVYTGLMLHGRNASIKWDRNNDGFQDNILGEDYILLNRWRFIGDNGWRGQFGVKGVFKDQAGGQYGDFFSTAEMPANLWRLKLNTKRIEGWAKMGYVSDLLPWRSTGLMLSAMYHDTQTQYGLNAYDANQTSIYFNYIQAGILSNTTHKFKTGVSFQYDGYNEVFNDSLYTRDEIVPGAYFEYSFLPNDNFTAVAGLRTDYHNIYGGFVTPRLHVRYAPGKTTVFRFSGGRGQKTANIFAENSGLMASSRTWFIEGDGSDKPYGLEQEVAWNYGFSMTQDFKLFNREGMISGDVFRTDFINQIVVDVDNNTREVRFYNLDGQSYSNSFQVQVDYELLKRLDLRAAYRYFDVKTTYKKGLLEKPLVSAHRAFVNLGYETPSLWKFDYTVNFQGSKRIPYTGDNIPLYQLPERSPNYVVMNAQITKSWKNNFEVYLGVENLTNFRQDSPILSSEIAFSKNFDASMVWGPVFGRNTYIGLRYALK